VNPEPIDPEFSKSLSMVHIQRKNGHTVAGMRQKQSFENMVSTACYTNCTRNRKGDSDRCLHYVAITACSGMWSFTTAGNDAID